MPWEEIYITRRLERNQHKIWNEFNLIALNQVSIFVYGNIYG